MIPIVMLLLIPILPAAICGVMSMGRRVGWWLALSWVMSFGIVTTIVFVQAPTMMAVSDMAAGTSEAAVIETGKLVGAGLAGSLYWLVTGVLAFFGIRRIRAGQNAGGKS